MKRKTLLISTAGAVLAAAAVAGVISSASAASAPGIVGAPGKVDRATIASFDRMAQAALDRRTAALLNTTAARQAAPQADAHVSLAAGLARTEDQVVSSLRARKARLAAVGEVYSAGRTKVTVDNVVVNGGRADVYVTETTTLTYKKLRGDEPATTGFQAKHDVTFAATSQGRWQLTGIEDQLTGGVPQVNAPAPNVASAASVDPLQGTPADTSWPASPLPKGVSSKGYNYAAMAAYAEKYWSRYNPAYRQFNGAGGDCTNFISQSLKAGGWKNAPGIDSDYHNWWYSADSESWTWVGANDWSWFALSSKRVTNLKNVYQLGVGDILQMDFNRDGSKDHSMIVTYRSRSGMPYVTYHSTNTYRRSVASLVMSFPDAVYYAYRT
ncbi:hypothetical protein ABIA32_000173 [Streptacidiphilus sp. MAP12-20]|uniref:amidase domain-containing protein n=1 Tax=Streptacidiphilus sp. MAP12-20 TaxID=3156299 RepID=UPI0035133A26